MQRELTFAPRIHRAYVDLEVKARLREVGGHRAGLFCAPRLIDRAAGQLRHRRQGGQHALIGQRQRADITGHIAMCALARNLAAESPSHRHVLGEIQNAFGLDLGPQFLGQPADAEQLPQKHRHWKTVTQPRGIRENALGGQVQRTAIAADQSEGAYGTRDDW